jgi:hypothetical protein
VVTSADDADPKFACRTAAEVKVEPARGWRTTTVPTANGPSEYLFCAVPPAIPVVNVSALVAGHEADLYAPASTVRLPPPSSVAVATTSEVARFVARRRRLPRAGATGLHGPHERRQRTNHVGRHDRISDKLGLRGLAVDLLCAVLGHLSRCFHEPYERAPGLYSCVRSAPRAAWTCRSDASTAMGGRAELLGPSPQVALLDGLANAVTVYANPAAVGDHVAAEAPRLLDQGAGADAQSCLLYGPVGSPVAFVCVDTDDVVARYDIPQAVTGSSYVTAALTSEARSLPPSALEVPAPLRDAATQTLRRVGSGLAAGHLGAR